MKINAIRVASAIFVIIFLFAIWQYDTYKSAEDFLSTTINVAKKCTEGDRDYCSYLRGTNENLESYISKLIRPLATEVTSLDSYRLTLKDLLNKSESEMIKSEKERENERQSIAAIANDFKEIKERSKVIKLEEAKSLDKFKIEFGDLGSPKILYSCGSRISYIAGRGLSNYNAIYFEAKKSCDNSGEFSVIESHK